MMSSDFYFRDKIPVAVIGVQNGIGQKLVQLLAHHPWFEIAVLCDVMEWVGQPYSKVIPESLHLPEPIKNMQIRPCEMPFPCSLIFSTIADEEKIIKDMDFAEAGYYVISHASHFSPPSEDLTNHLPLIVAEVNRDQFPFLQAQQERIGGILMSPQPAVIAFTLALKPLNEAFGLESIHAVTLQPLHHDFINNRTQEIGFLINSLEENLHIEKQTLRILGHLQDKHLQPASFKMSVQGYRLNELQNAIASVSVKFKTKPKSEEIIQAWKRFGSEAQRLQLPNAPYQPLYYIEPFEEALFPPDKNMSIYLGQLSPCSVLDYKFSLCFDPLMRGIIGSMLLNAEVLVTQGKIYW